MMRSSLLAVLALFAAGAALPARAQIEVDVTQGALQPLPIAIETRKYLASLGLGVA